jgi:NAD(P)-dependent dehydrogenase (short-subunit alcohol dehydrogenase family)
MATSIPAPLAGKVSIITGGSRDIGGGIAIDFANKGCTGIAITYAGNKDAAKH